MTIERNGIISSVARAYVVLALCAHLACGDASPATGTPSASDAPSMSTLAQPITSSVAQGPTTEVTIALPNFGAARSDELDASMMKFLRDYEAIETSGWGDAPVRRRGWAYGAFINGELNMKQAISGLIDDIDLLAPTSPSADGPWSLGQYPARDALLKLGYWSVRALLDRMEQEASDAKRALMADAVVRVLGTKMARWYLRDLINDVRVKADLEKALAALAPADQPAFTVARSPIPATQRESYTFRVPDLTGDTPPGTHAAVMDFIATDRLLRADLASRLADPRTSDVGRTYLIYFFAEIAAEEAVEPLLDFIDFKAPFADVKGSAQRWQHRHAPMALRQLGFTSVRAIMRRLPTETDQKRRDAMCGVVHSVVGREVGRAMLDDALKSETDKKRQAGWRAAIATQEQTP